MARKKYGRLDVTAILLELDGCCLAASRPIEAAADVSVNDFGDGNAAWIGSDSARENDFNLTFE